ncbi:MAG: hypothetical protein AAF558_09580 [Verrucomicrobiota bacterium]
MASIVKRLFLIFLGIGLCALLVGFGWKFLRQHRISQAKEVAHAALQERRLAATETYIQILEKIAPNDPETIAIKAQWYALIHPPQAPSAWQTALKISPDNEEYRVAYILSLIQLNQLSSAQTELDHWPLRGKPSLSFHRAVMAVAFAQGDIEKALKQANQLEALDPQSSVNQLNRAKLQLRSKEARSQYAGKESLEILLTHPTHRYEAAKALIQYALGSQSTKDLLNTLELIEEKKLTLEERLLIFEARSKADLEISENEIADLWRDSLENPYMLNRLAGWMVFAGRSHSLIQSFKSSPPSSPWQFPLGLPLAEAYKSTADPAPALKGLRAADWRRFNDLKLFTQAFLAQDTPLAASFLESAVTKAARRRNGLDHLESTARAWGWREGLLAILRTQITITPVRSKAFLVLMNQYEQHRDMQGLLKGSLSLLKAQPNHTPSLNNAAYFRILLGLETEVALEQARQAFKNAPENPNIQSTLVLALVANQQCQEAKEHLESLQSADASPSALLALIAAHNCLDLKVSDHVRARLESASFLYAEERKLQQDLLSKLDLIQD